VPRLADKLSGRPLFARLIRQHARRLPAITLHVQVPLARHDCLGVDEVLSPPDRWELTIWPGLSTAVPRPPSRHRLLSRAAAAARPERIPSRLTSSRSPPRLLQYAGEEQGHDRRGNHPARDESLGGLRAELALQFTAIP